MNFTQVSITFPDYVEIDLLTKHVKDDVNDFHILENLLQRYLIFDNIRRLLFISWGSKMGKNIPGIK